MQNQKWEYLVEQVDVQDHDATSDALRNGDEGWELVAVIETPKFAGPGVRVQKMESECFVKLFFKRPKVEPREGGVTW